MKEVEWNDYVERSKTWGIRMGYDLLHSQAYKELRYAPAIKVLNWIQEKIRFAVNKKKRGRDRYRVINEEFSFTYREAKLRGLTTNQFSKGLKQLCHFGFIDVKKHGSGLMGDYNIYVKSERWRKFGTCEFVDKEFPKSIPIGFRKMGKINL